MLNDLPMPNEIVDLVMASSVFIPKPFPIGETIQGKTPFNEVVVKPVNFDVPTSIAQEH